MIEFGCPHCGKRLVLPESYAGRDGWCRYCKGIIKMPHPGGEPSEPELPLAEKYARLERMFKYAAAVVDEHRQLQNKLQTENGAWAEENRIRVKAQLEVDRLQNALAEAESERDSAIQVVDRLTAEVGTLRETNNQLESTRDDAVTQRAELETKLTEIVVENDGLLERLLEAEQSIESQQTLTRESQERLNAEHESYECRLTALRDELSAAEDDLAALQSRYETAAESEQQLRVELNAMVQASLAKQKELELALTEARKERDAADEARQEPPARWRTCPRRPIACPDWKRILRIAPRDWPRRTAGVPHCAVKWTNWNARRMRPRNAGPKR
jgi:peptidoglycan hydrolase CwlO-like protein